MPNERGASGLIDDVVRDLGMSNRGITGLSYQDTLGTAHPSANALVSTAVIDGYFFLGGILYCCHGHGVTTFDVL